MEFKLSDSLSSTLVSYDVTRKKQAAQAKRSTNVKKKKHQFGNINDLIPFDIVSAEDQQKAADHINKSLCENRVYEFYTGIQGNPIAFIFHYESLWVACWLPWNIKDQCFTSKDSLGQDYIYGFSFAHRDNGSTINKVGKEFCGGLYVHPEAQNIGKLYNNRKHLSHYQRKLETKQVGKSKFVWKQIFVNASMISSGYEEEPWDSPSNDSNISNWHQKSSNIRTVTRTWKDKLAKRLLRWDRSSDYGYGGSTELWERMRGNNNSLHYLFKLNYEQELKSVIKEKDSYKYERSNRTHSYGYDSSQLENEANRQLLIKNIIPDDFIADYESIVKIYKDLEKYEILFKYNFFDKKFVKRTITEASNKINASFKLSDNILATKEERNVEKIMGPILKLDKYFSHICFLYHIWGEKLPFDYLQNIDLYSSMEIPDLYRGYGYIKEEINIWLENNMPVTSYIQLLNTQYKEKVEEYKTSEKMESYKGNYNKYLDIYDIRFHDLNDSFNMLNRLIKEHGQDFKKPKRWRIAEFHDYVQAEAWKLSNEKEPLPQDLFPTPVKATLDLNNALNIVQMTFFQPRDTHQLAEWGRAVRNCVGSAGYAEKIRKKRNFIVLAMIENQPRYTIQLTLDRGVLHVDQIADVSNARLSEQERSDTEKLFKEALNIRGNQSTN
tara:strand:- start:144 stop:2141 length:1998 start_codon:yes stop_codon:yes gene_type:complete